MSILDEIITYKRIEVKDSKRLIPYNKLEKSEFFNRSVYSLCDSLLNLKKTGIIAEFKKKSPSKGIINNSANVQHITKTYAEAGASGLSILTDEKFFGGIIGDLIEARKVNTIPILRKEFIIDEYQILEAKAIGADAILLIAACLDEKQIYNLAKFARQLSLEVLMEVHTKDELQMCNEYIDIIGVNNRNLKTFDVDIAVSVELVNLISSKFLKISESGISNPKSLKKLKKVGFDGFLIGENFMKETDPAKAFIDFVQQL